ncbi:MAG: glycoside hydrolase family 32 protein [Ardenticatenaceae bacterium]|nr:glycoside hydrolase family 32 protein [Ardenticatenaceae bacterium]HBY94742.1 glycosyl hydrolase family 32 [Chloroflexota bacterium]
MNQRPQPDAIRAEPLRQDPHRPQYHFLPSSNWMNDPNGLIQWKGEYHLFYQHNPNGAFHADMHWGHAVSKDLVHWEHLPIALAPTPGGPDKGGVYSGCAVDNNGVPTLIYTGVFPEVQCLAVGIDDLVSWKKRADPVIAAPPPDLDLFGFRDPCVFRDGGSWYMALGAGIKRVGGAVLLYKSPDLHEWEYIGPLLVDDSGLPNKGWECPAPFPLGDKWVLIVSVTPRANVDYFIGTFDGRRFHPEVHRRLDYGRYFYAPQTFLDDQGRRVLIGWIWEGRSEQKDIEAGWSGIQSVPRVLTLRPGGYLGVEPARELQQLRRTYYYGEDLSLATGVPYQVDIQSNQLEILLAWQPDAAAEIGLILAQSPQGEEQTKIVFNCERGQLCVDRRLSNAVGDVDFDTQIAPLTLGEGEPLKLHVFFDHSVIEIFANDRLCLTSRIYPTRDDSLRVSFFAHGGDTRLRTAEIWELQSIW